MLVRPAARPESKRSSAGREVAGHDVEHGFLIRRLIHAGRRHAAAGEDGAGRRRASREARLRRARGCEPDARAAGRRRKRRAASASGHQGPSPRSPASSGTRSPGGPSTARRGSCRPSATVNTQFSPSLHAVDGVVDADRRRRRAVGRPRARRHAQAPLPAASRGGSGFAEVLERQAHHVIHRRPFGQKAVVVGQLRDAGGRIGSAREGVRGDVGQRRPCRRRRWTPSGRDTTARRRRRPRPRRSGNRGRPTARAAPRACLPRTRTRPPAPAAPQLGRSVNAQTAAQVHGAAPPPPAPANWRRRRGSARRAETSRRPGRRLPTWPRR